MSAAEEEILSEENVYAGVYRSLVVGMTVSTILFALGVVLAFVQHRDAMLSPEQLRGYYRLSLFFPALFHADAVAVLMLATVVMILTPIARVGISIAAFAVDRDYRFVFVTSIVALAIGITLLCGLLGWL